MYIAAYVHIYRSVITKHVMPPEFGRKWETECLNTRFPLPALLCAGYRVKLTKKIKIIVLQFCIARTCFQAFD